MIEDNLGIVFASAPAIRQFFAYHHRTGTFLPSDRRQLPNEDFARMRRRVNLRDIFWHRNAGASDQRPIICDERSVDAQSSSKADTLAAHKSALDYWQAKIRSFFSRSQSTPGSAMSPSEGEAQRGMQSPSGGHESNQEGLVQRTQDTKALHRERNHDTDRSRVWDLLPRRGQKDKGGDSVQPPFLFDDSGLGSAVADTQSNEEPSRVDDDTRSRVQSDPRT